MVWPTNLPDQIVILYSSHSCHFRELQPDEAEATVLLQPGAEP